MKDSRLVATNFWLRAVLLTAFDLLLLLTHCHSRLDRVGGVIIDDSTGQFVAATLLGKLRWCWLELGGTAIMLQEFWKEGDHLQESNRRSGRHALCRGQLEISHRTPGECADVRPVAETFKA
jgi:hypothetical protein